MSQMAQGFPGNVFTKCANMVKVTVSVWQVGFYIQYRSGSHETDSGLPKCNSRAALRRSIMLMVNAM